MTGKPDGTQGAIVVDLARASTRSKPPTQSQVGANKRRLKQALEIYFQSEGRADPVEWYVLDGHFLVYWRERRDVKSLLSARESNWYTHALSVRHIKADVLRAFLQDLWGADGKSIAELDSRVNRWIKQRSQRFRGKFKGKTGFKALFGYLVASKEALTFQEIRTLAETLDIHPLMLDPLLSDVVHQPFLILKCPGAEDVSAGSRRTASARGTKFAYFEPAGHAGDRTRGQRAQYWIPSAKLNDSDVAFVYLVIDPGGQSDVHHHPGDEFLYVLEGSVDVAFADSGVQIALRRGDYAQYYSEQNHSVINHSDGPAHLFIIRFYQVSDESSRQKMRQEVWSQIVTRASGFDHQHSRVSLRPSTLAWVMESAAGRSRHLLEKGEPIPNEVLDRGGLARLLNRLPSPKPAAWKRFLQEHSALYDKNRYASPDDWLWALATNQITVPRSSLATLADLFGAFPFSIFSCLFNTALPVAAVKRRAPSATAGASDWVNVTDVVKDLTSLSQPAGVKYEIPTRSLACSDVSIAYLALDPQTNTQEGKHGGFELLLPIEGEVTVSYASTTKQSFAVSARRRELVHFRSDVPHILSNRGSSNAELFLIRFHAPDTRPTPRRAETSGATGMKRNSSDVTVEKPVRKRRKSARPA
jgi:quercetin dioxygenase-like cupin family protein